jgi:hypothetical protein
MEIGRKLANALAGNQQVLKRLKLRLPGDLEKMKKNENFAIKVLEKLHGLNKRSKSVSTKRELSTFVRANGLPKSNEMPKKKTSVVKKVLKGAAIAGTVVGGVALAQDVGEALTIKRLADGGKKMDAWKAGKQYVEKPFGIGPGKGLGIFKKKIKGDIEVGEKEAADSLKDQLKKFLPGGDKKKKAA